MKRFYLPLFWKFTIAIISIVAIFGTINLILIWSKVVSLKNEQTQELGVLIANYTKNASYKALINNDISTLNSIASEIVSSDSSIAFIKYIKNGNEDITGCYNKDIKPALNDSIFINNLKKNNITLKTSTISVNRQSKLSIKIGIIERGSNTKVMKVIKPFLIMITIFLVIGIFGAFVFAHIITNPIKSISSTVDQLDFESLRKPPGTRISVRKRMLGIIPLKYRTLDELDFLADKFNSMLSRLEDAYKELENSYIKLMQAEKLASIGTLTAGVAHEINNPIAGIQNCVRRIRKNPENYSQNEEYLELISDAANKTEQVVRRLLDFTRTADTNFKEIDIADVIEKSILLISYKLEKHKISIINKLPHKLPSINGNFNQLEQVFINLLMNSIDAIEMRSNRGEIFDYIIEISSSNVNGNLYVYIKDTGIGIQEGAIEKIFDPFFTTKDVGKGTGLGLFVSYNILKSHNAVIRVENVLDKGITFVVEFMTC